jgi:hypothetical protein
VLGSRHSGADCACAEGANITQANAVHRLPIPILVELRDTTIPSSTPAISAFPDFRRNAPALTSAAGASR